VVVVGLQAGFFDPFAQHFGSAEFGGHSSSTGGRYPGVVTATSCFVIITGGFVGSSKGIVGLG
jgi:hypothetical protein